MNKFFETIVKAVAWVRYGPISGAGWVLVIGVLVGSMSLGASGHYAAREYQQQRSLYGKTPLAWLDYFFPATGTIGEALYKSIASQLSNIKIAASEEESSTTSPGSSSSDGAQSAQPVDAPGSGAPSRSGPEFPRIANLFGSGLTYHEMSHAAPPEFSGSRLDYWSKLDLFAGMGIFYAWNWEHHIINETEVNRWNTAKSAILAVNPKARFLSYEFISTYSSGANDVQPGWILDPDKRYVDLGNTEALAYMQTKIRQYDLDTYGVDGVFMDEPRWNSKPLSLEAAHNLATSAGEPIIIGNLWDLRGKGSMDKSLVNGAVSEDEFNRVLMGSCAGTNYNYEETMTQYLEWSAQAKTPRYNIMVMANPNDYGNGCVYDYTAWNALSTEQKEAVTVGLKYQHLDMMRYGLTSTLMGDGYFEWSLGMAHGTWYWYAEYDAPLGYPKANAQILGNGLWRREFDGGLVYVNPTGGNLAVTFDSEYQTSVTQGDGSVQTSHSTAFTIPAHDGRIFVPYGS